MDQREFQAVDAQGEGGSLDPAPFTTQRAQA